MNRTAFLASWDHLRILHGITTRLVDLIPADKLDSNPIPKMRTPKQLIFHTYGQVLRDITKGLVAGEIKQTDDAAITAIKDKGDLASFMKECWSEADRAAKTVTDAHLSAIVKTPWGMDMPGAMACTVINDEYLHHRPALRLPARARTGRPDDVGLRAQRTRVPPGGARGKLIRRAQSPGAETGRQAGWMPAPGPRLMGRSFSLATRAGRVLSPPAT